MDENALLANISNHKISVVEINSKTYYQINPSYNYDVDFYKEYEEPADYRSPMNFSLSGCWLEVSGRGNSWYENRYWEGHRDDPALPDPYEPVSALPRLMFDGPIYVDNVQTVQIENFQYVLSATGGYLDSVTISLSATVNDDELEKFSYPIGVSGNPVVSELTVLGVRPASYAGGLRISNLFTQKRMLVDVTPDCVIGKLHNPDIGYYDASAYSDPSSSEALYLRGTTKEVRKYSDDPNSKPMVSTSGFLGSDVKSFIFDDYGLYPTTDPTAFAEYKSSLNGTALNVLCYGGSWSAPKFQGPF